MFRIFLDVCCLNNDSQPLPGQGEQMERVIETLVFPVLADLFEAALIEGIRVRTQPAAATQPALCSFQMWAGSPLESLSQSIDRLEVQLEELISCTLLQHFSLVMVNTVSVYHIPDARLDISTFLRSA
ncbi:MAG TPA: hypothetical protein VGF67_29945 [Ktedonobacteraceae bacterium]|jgi:hypothetical protein